MRLAHVLVGSNDLKRALPFYDELFAVVGIGMFVPHYSGGKMYGEGFHKTLFGVVGTYDGKPASVGNGTMVAFALDSADQVDAFYAKALELGGSDEGPPGKRGGDDSRFYAAYFRDLDGNKLCVFKILASADER